MNQAMTTYLPELGISDLVHALESRDWSAVQEKLGLQHYERMGLDRALASASAHRPVCFA